MSAPACAVATLDGGRWIGFAPTLDDTYDLVVGEAQRSVRGSAEPDDLVALAIVYFEDRLGEPPEELAATHADIGALIRHLAEAEPDAEQRARLGEAVDAIDDGLAADVVVGRLVRCLRGAEDAVERLERLATAVIGSAG